MVDYNQIYWVQNMQASGALFLAVSVPESEYQYQLLRISINSFRKSMSDRRVQKTISIFNLYHMS